MGEVLCGHSRAAPALHPAVPATESERLAAGLCVGLLAALCSSPVTAGGMFSPLLLPQAQQGRRALAPEQESQTPTTYQPGQKESTETGLLGKASTCWDTGRKVWDNHFPPALPAQRSVKPEGGTLCSLPCVQGKQGVNKIQ